MNVTITTLYKEGGERSEGPDAQCSGKHKVYLIHETNTYKTKGKLNWGAKGTNWGGGAIHHSQTHNTKHLYTCYLQTNDTYIHTHTQRHLQNTLLKLGGYLPGRPPQR